MELVPRIYSNLASDLGMDLKEALPDFLTYGGVNLAHHLQLYKQYIDNHEVPNAIKGLLKGKRWEILSKEIVQEEHKLSELFVIKIVPSQSKILFKLKLKAIELWACHFDPVDEESKS